MDVFPWFRTIAETQAAYTLGCFSEQTDSSVFLHPTSPRWAQVLQDATTCALRVTSLGCSNSFCRDVMSCREWIHWVLHALRAALYPTRLRWARPRSNRNRALCHFCPFSQAPHWCNSLDPHWLCCCCSNLRLRQKIRSRGTDEGAIAANVAGEAQSFTQLQAVLPLPRIQVGWTHDSHVLWIETSNNLLQWHKTAWL